MFLILIRNYSFGGEFLLRGIFVFVNGVDI